MTKRVRAVLGGLAILGGLVACTGPQTTAYRSPASLAPRPPGAQAFCIAHGGACDPVPAATAMADGGAAATPRGWRSYCARHRADAGCHHG